MKNLLDQATEHQIQTSIINYLKMKGYYVQRMNSGKYSVGEGRFKRFIQGADAGTPDIMSFKHSAYDDGISNLIFWEVKRPGKKATPIQTAKMQELEEHGALCFVVHSVDEVVKILKEV